MMIQVEAKSLESIKKFKSAIDSKKNKKLAIYTFAKDEFNFLATDVLNLIEMGILKKTPWEDSRTKSIYSWEAGEPTYIMLEDIVKNRKTLQNKRSKATHARKKLKKKEAAFVNAIKETDVTPTKEVSQDVILEKKEIETIPVKEKTKEVVAPTDKKNMPISVEVVSDGGKKTVTIKIEV
jgi:hypothetical protein